MPTYEFRCPKGHEFTRFYKTISGSAMQLPCPECNAMAGRIMSVSGGFQFKGSGFYLTDYGKNAHRGEGGGRRKEEGEAPSKAEPKAESKAEPKAESKAESAPAKADAKPKAESREPKGETTKAKAETKPSK